MAALILLILFVLAWVVLIFPRQRELRRHQKLMGDLEVGDEVMMSSGIYGSIVELEGDYAQLQVADGLTLKIARRSIAAKVTEVGQTPPASEGQAVDGQAGEGLIDLSDTNGESGHETDRHEGNEA